MNGLPARATQRRAKRVVDFRIREGVETIITRLKRQRHGEGMVQTTHGTRQGSGGKSRSGKHNPLVLGSNPSGPTINPHPPSGLPPWLWWGSEEGLFHCDESEPPVRRRPSFRSFRRVGRFRRHRRQPHNPDIGNSCLSLILRRSQAAKCSSSDRHSRPRPLADGA